MTEREGKNLLTSSAVCLGLARCGLTRRTQQMPSKFTAQLAYSALQSASPPRLSLTPDPTSLQWLNPSPTVSQSVRSSCAIPSQRLYQSEHTELPLAVNPSLPG